MTSQVYHFLILVISSFGWFPIPITFRVVKREFVRIVRKKKEKIFLYHTDVWVKAIIHSDPEPLFMVSRVRRV